MTMVHTESGDPCVVFGLTAEHRHSGEEEDEAWRVRAWEGPV